MKNYLPLRISLVTFLSLLCACLQLKAQRVTIIESLSGNSWAIQDTIWQNVANSNGYSAQVVEQTALNSLDSLTDADILIVSSGTISFPGTARLQTIINFVRSGRPAYIQAEYLKTYQGNKTFKTLMDSLQLSFNWEDEVSGNLVPMNVLAPFSQTPKQVSSLNYFNYGVSGSGGAHIDSFLEYQGKYFAFYYSDLSTCNGAVLTTSDEDWVWQNKSPDLMANILARLTDGSACLETHINTISPPQQAMKVYPIPFSSQLTCTVPAGANRVEVINQNGQVVLAQPVRGGTTQILNTDFLPAGLYLVHASGDNTDYRSKVVKW